MLLSLEESAKIIRCAQKVNGNSELYFNIYYNKKAVIVNNLYCKIKRKSSCDRFILYSFMFSSSHHIGITALLSYKDYMIFNQDKILKIERYKKISDNDLYKFCWHGYNLTKIKLV
jgi:hypothetical protein